MSVHGEKSPYLRKMPITFGTVAQNSIKSIFFGTKPSELYIMFGFEEVRILLSFLVMTSFAITGLSNQLIFVEHTIRYQHFKFQPSRMSGSNFTEGVENNPHSALSRPKSPGLSQ